MYPHKEEIVELRLYLNQKCSCKLVLLSGSQTGRGLHEVLTRG